MKGNKMVNFFKKKFFLFILLFFLVISISQLNYDLPIVENDSPFYFVLAQSISSGQGYRDLYYPGNPPNVEFPFFYPLFLALVLKVFPGSIIGLKLVSVFFGAASLWIIYVFFRDKLKKQNINMTNQGVSVLLNPYAIVFFTCINLWFVSFSTNIFPEIPYMFFSIGALWLFDKYKECNKAVCKYLFITAVSFAIAFFTRSIGLALVISGFIYFIFVRKEYKKGSYLFGVWGFLSLPWVIRTVLVSPKAISKHYVGQVIYGNKESILNVLKNVFWNIIHYWQIIAQFLLPDFFLSKVTEGEVYFHFLYGAIAKKEFFLDCRSMPILFNFLAIGFFSITLLGFINRLKKKEVVEIYILCYLCIMFIFPARSFLESGNRFFVPLLPFVLYYLFTGVSLLMGLVKSNAVDVKEDIKNPGNVNKIVFLVFIVLLLGNFIAVLRSIKYNIGYNINYKYLSNIEKKDYYPYWMMERFVLSPWIKINTDLKSIFMVDYPPPFYLASNRKAVFFTETPSPEKEKTVEEIFYSINDNKVDYIVTNLPRDEKIVEKLNKKSERILLFPLAQFESVDSSVKIYKVSKINSDAKTANQEGVDWYIKSDYIKAKESFKKAIEIEPHPLAYFNLGRCYQKEEQIDFAFSAYQKAVELQSNYETARNLIDIIKQEKKITADKVDGPFEYVKLGKLYLNDYKSVDISIALFKKACIIAPKEASIYCELGIAYIIDESYDSALSEFNKALNLEPNLALKYKIKHYIKLAKRKKKENKLYYQKVK